MGKGKTRRKSKDAGRCRHLLLINMKILAPNAVCGGGRLGDVTATRFLQPAALLDGINPQMSAQRCEKRQETRHRFEVLGVR